jgi:GON domain
MDRFTVIHPTRKAWIFMLQQSRAAASGLHRRRIMKSFAIGLGAVAGMLGLLSVAGTQPPAVQASTPAVVSSCSAVASNDSSANDGTYALDLSGHILPIYCANMATAPAEYLPLVHTGASNFSQYTAGGASPGSNVVTHYIRVRLNPSNLTVNIADQKFSTSTGSLDHAGAGQTVTSMPYAVAMDATAAGARLASPTSI